MPDESDEDHPIDGDSLMADNEGDNAYDTIQPEEELGMESEVTA